MPENRLKELWSRGEAALGAWVSIPSPFAAELVARAGFDYVCIDMQHGLVDYQVALGMLQAMDASDAVPLVRPPGNDFATINKVLDAGALGVIVPMVSSPDQARAAVGACRYPPAGARSFGPTRAGFAAGPDYFARANDTVLCIPMIETREAVEDLDAILAVDGVDAVYVGPNDLSLTLGQGPGLDNPPPYQDAYQQIAKACAARGLAAGIHANARLAAKHRSTGYRMITISSDVGALVGGAARDLATARG